MICIPPAPASRSSLPSWSKKRKRVRGPSLWGSRGPHSLYRQLKSLELLVTRDRSAVLSFLGARYPISLSFWERIALLKRYVQTTNAVRCYHTQAEILAVADAIFALSGRPQLTVVEAGAGKGASTAKLSLAAARAGGKLHVFDSFRGLPPNQESHTRIDGSGPVVFKSGAFCGRIPTVQRNLEMFGAPEICTLHKGWFHETMPQLTGPLDIVLLDVDLLSSTRTCLVHLFPEIRQGGALFTQDGHLKAIAQLLANNHFWINEVGVEPPVLEGLGTRKMVVIRPR